MKNAKADIVEIIFEDFTEKEDYLSKYNKSNVKKITFEFHSILENMLPKKENVTVEEKLNEICWETEKFGFINGFEYAFNLCKKFM